MVMVISNGDCDGDGDGDSDGDGDGDGYGDDDVNQHVERSYIQRWGL